MKKTINLKNDDPGTGVERGMEVNETHLNDDITSHPNVEEHKRGNVQLDLITAPQPTRRLSYRNPRMKHFRVYMSVTNEGYAQGFDILTGI